MKRKSATSIPMFEGRIVGRTITKKMFSGRIITGNKRVEEPNVMETEGRMQEI
jgi:hypothetical protein